MIELKSIVQAHCKRCGYIWTVDKPPAECVACGGWNTYRPEKKASQDENVPGLYNYIVGWLEHQKADHD